MEGVLSGEKKPSLENSQEGEPGRDTGRWLEELKTQGPFSGLILCSLSEFFSEEGPPSHMSFGPHNSEKCPSREKTAFWRKTHTKIASPRKMVSTCYSGSHLPSWGDPDPSSDPVALGLSSLTVKSGVWLTLLFLNLSEYKHTFLQENTVDNTF